MEAYHIRTNEPSKHDPTGFERFDLDSIYVPEKKVLVGFVKWPNLGGTVLNYSGLCIYCDRARAIIDGKKLYGKKVEGDVIGKVNLDDGIISKMKKNSHESEVETTKGFDGSTDCLVKILSGEYRKKSFFEKLSLRKKLEKLIFK